MFDLASSFHQENDQNMFALPKIFCFFICLMFFVNRIVFVIFLAVNSGFTLLLHTGAVLLSVTALHSVHGHQKEGTQA